MRLGRQTSVIEPNYNERANKTETHHKRQNNHDVTNTIAKTREKNYYDV